MNNIIIRTATAITIALSTVGITTEPVEARPQTAQESHYICIKNWTPGTQAYSQCRDQQRTYERGGGFDLINQSGAFDSFMEGFNQGFSGY